MKTTLVSQDGLRSVSVTVEVERTSTFGLKSSLKHAGFTAAIRGYRSQSHLASESAELSGMRYSRSLLSREDFTARVTAISGDCLDSDMEAIACAACLAVLRHHSADVSLLDLKERREVV